MFRYDLLDSLGKIAYHEGPHNNEGGYWNPHAPHPKTAPEIVGGPSTNVTNPNPDFGTPKDAQASGIIGAASPGTGQSDPVKAADFTGTYTGPEGNLFPYRPAPAGGIGQFLTGKGQKTWEGQTGQAFQGTSFGQPYTSQPDTTPSGVPSATTDAVPTTAEPVGATTEPLVPEDVPSTAPPIGGKVPAYAGADIAGTQRRGTSPKAGGATLEAESLGEDFGNLTLPVNQRLQGQKILDFDFGTSASREKIQELAGLLNKDVKGGLWGSTSSGGERLELSAAMEMATSLFAAKFPGQTEELSDTNIAGSKEENLNQDIDMLFNRLQRTVGTRTINDYASSPELMQQLAGTVRDAITLPEGWSTDVDEAGQVTLRKDIPVGEGATWSGKELTAPQQTKLARAVQMHQDAVRIYNDLQKSSPALREQREELEFKGAEASAQRDFDLAQRYASQDFASEQQRNQQFFTEREGVIQRSFQQTQNEMSRSLENRRINNQATSMEDARQVSDLQRDLDRERYKAEIVAGQGLKEMDIGAMTAMEDQQFTHKMQMMASETVQVFHREEFVQNKHKEVETALIKARDEGQMDRLEAQITADWLALNLEIDSQQVSQQAEAELKKALQEQAFQNEFVLMDNATKNRLDEMNSQHMQDRNQLMFQISEQQRAQGVEITSAEAMALAERQLRREQFGAEIEGELTGIREQLTSAEAMQTQRLTAEAGMQTEALGAQAQNLASQISANAAAQGQQISADAALAQANRQLQEGMQAAGITEAQRAQQAGITSEQTMQAAQLAAQQVMGGADREATAQNLASQITAEAQSRGEVISAENARAEADRQLQLQLTQLSGTQQLGQISAQAEAEQQTFQFQLGEQEALAQRQREALGIVTPQEQIQQAQTVTTGYMQNLNTALSQASTSGDYGMVNDALAQALPPAPPGIVWDRNSGVFQQRGGFEGRDIDVATQQWISAVTPAFKARDRAEQASTVATQIQLDSVARQQDIARARQQFEDDMLTGDIDSAEEANTRMVMAETASVAIEQKMQHVQMLFTLLQNPVQLAMAKKHGLLGQIEAVLGFTMSNVADTAGIDGVPTSNQWQNLDPEQQAFSMANYVEQGGSPDAFLRMIAGSAPAQMQQLQYGVL